MPGLADLVNTNRFLSTGADNPAYMQFQDAQQNLGVMKRPILDQYQTLFDQAHQQANATQHRGGEVMKAFFNQYGHNNDYLMANQPYAQAYNQFQTQYAPFINRPISHWSGAWPTNTDGGGGGGGGGEGGEGGSTVTPMTTSGGGTTQQQIADYIRSITNAQGTVNPSGFQQTWNAHPDVSMGDLNTAAGTLGYNPTQVSQFLSGNQIQSPIASFLQANINRPRAIQRAWNRNPNITMADVFGDARSLGYTQNQIGNYIRTNNLLGPQTGGLARLLNMHGRI